VSQVTSPIEIVVKVKDQASAETAAIAGKIRAEMKSAGGGGEGVKVPVEPDMAGFDEEVTTKIRRVKPDAVEVPVEVRRGHVESSLREAAAAAEPAAEKAGEEIGESLANGLTRDSQGKLRNAMGRFASEAEKAAAGIDDVGNRAASAGGKAGSSGGGFDLAGLKMAGMVTAAFALAPALAAIPAVAATVTVGAGTMALGLGGVIKALHDYGAASGGAGQSGAQLAATAFSNAVAIRHAEQSIQDAKKQAARGAQDSAEQIENAQRGVADAEQQAASAAQSSADSIASAQRGVESSAYSLAQAEERLQDAQKAELDAQKALTQARQDAADQLKDLNNASADSHLAVERATLNVAKAQENLAKTLGSSLSTDSQKKDAQLSLREAQQGLVDAQQRSVEASQKADAANKTGVDGMQGVVQAQDAVAKGALGVRDAQHGVVEATQAQADAQKALARAVQSASDQQKSSAESVAKAEQSLADAQRSADRQRQDSMESVAKAEQNLADTYKQQQLAAAAAASAGGGAADKFAQDMANLTPAGQAFVKQLISMRDGAKQLSDTAQTAMLPGLTTMLKDTGPLLPIFNSAIRTMGGIIGDTAVKFGDLMKSPAFQGQLTQVLSDGAGLAKDFGDGLVGATKGIMKAASDAGPIVSGLGSGIDTLLSKGLPDFFSGLVSNAAGIGSFFQGVLQLVSDLAGPLGTVSGAVATALAPAVQVLASPDVQRSLQSIAGSIAAILVVLTPVITMFAQGLAGGLRVVAPLLASTAKFMQDNHRWVVPLAQAVGIATVAWWGLNAALAANPLILIGTLVAGLVMGLIYAWEHFAGFRDFVHRMWSDIKQWFSDGVQAIDKALLWFVSLPGKFTHWLAGVSSAVGRGVGEAASWFAGLPGRVASAIGGYFSHLGADFSAWIGGVAASVAIKGGDVLKWFRDLPGRIVSALGNLGSTLWDAGTKLIKGFIDGISSMFGKVKDKLGELTDLLPFWKGPPGSDAVLLTHNGRLIIQGFIAGIDDQIPAVKAKLGGLTASLPALTVGAATVPDPLRLPNGGAVVSHANARPMLPEGAAGPARGGTVELQWVGPDGDELFTMIKRWIRVNYGSGPNSVQTALGQ
jgi:hypothetical protein